MNGEKRGSPIGRGPLTRRQVNRGLSAAGLSAMGLGLAGCARRAAGCDSIGGEAQAALNDAIDGLGGDRAIGAEPTPSAFDIYLSPHPDDVCFSLGILASLSGAGTLITVFSKSSFISEPISLSGNSAARAQRVTAIRTAEDRRFAAAAGLRFMRLGFLDAPLRGRFAFDGSHAIQDAEIIENPLLFAMNQLAGGRPAGLRPWLFCPMGIGGHADHLAVRWAVLRNLTQLRSTYQIGFYEDLPYASKWRLRLKGLASFDCGWGGRPLRRHSLYLGANLQRKLDLVRIYTSQFRRLPTTIERFSPARMLPSSPHEGLWIEA